MFIPKADFWQLFCKGTFVIWQSELFFGIFCSVSFVSRSLVFADSPRKFCLLFLPLGSVILENARILFGILNVYYKTKI